MSKADDKLKDWIDASLRRLHFNIDEEVKLARQRIYIRLEEHFKTTEQLPKTTPTPAALKCEGK